MYIIRFLPLLLGSCSWGCFGYCFSPLGIVVRLEGHGKREPEYIKGQDYGSSGTCGMGYINVIFSVIVRMQPLKFHWFSELLTLFHRVGSRVAELNS